MELNLSASQDAESNQAAAMAAEDSSVKTIEFLRVRLLAERAASKAARQQAQEIFGKVKALNARLEAEMENRKAAEAAMGRVFTVLKAKGLDMEGLVSEHRGGSVGSTLDDIKEMNEGPQDSFSSYTANPSIDTAELHTSTEENPSLQNHNGHVQLALRDDVSGSSITQKLKAMLQQIEEEVLSLPTERQPLKLELQGWVEHMARVLEKEREAAAMEKHAFNGSDKAAVNYPLKETTTSEYEANALTDKNGVYPPTMYPPPPAGRDSALPSEMGHSRRLSHDFLQSWPQEPLKNKPIIHPQMMKNGISSHSLRYPDRFTPNTPRRSDAFSIGGDASFLCAGFQKDQGRGLDQEGATMWSPPTGPRSRQLLSRPYDKVLMTQDRYMDLGHIPLNRGQAYPDRPYPNAINTQHRTSIAKHRTSALSLADTTKGQLGDILLALDAARQHVGNGEHSLPATTQPLEPTHMPRSEKMKAKGGYPCGYGEPAWRPLARSQAPIIQLPTSPASEHGYSPLESYSRHQRSSSVSTNHIISGWQRKGEVKLGNGITLYTD